MANVLHQYSDQPKAMLNKLFSPEIVPLLHNHEKIALEELNKTYSDISYLPRWTVDPLKSFADELNCIRTAKMRPLAHRAIFFTALHIVHLTFWTIAVPWASSVWPANDYIPTLGDGATSAIITLSILSFVVDLWVLIWTLLPGLTGSGPVDADESAAKVIWREERELKLKISSELENIFKRIDKDGPRQSQRSETYTTSDSILGLSLLCSELRSRASSFIPKTYTRSKLLTAKSEYECERKTIYFLHRVQYFSFLLTLVVAIIATFPFGIAFPAAAVISLAAGYASYASSKRPKHPLHSLASTPSEISFGNPNEFDSLA